MSLADEPTQPSARADRETSLVIGVIASAVPASLSVGATPLVVGALIDDRGLSQAGAAMVASAELLALSLAAITVARFLARGSRAKTAGVGLAVVLTMQLLSIQVQGLLMLLAVRAAVGLGGGVATASSSAAGAAARRPERIYALSQLAGGVLAAVFLLPLGIATARAGVSGAFGGLALISFVALPFVFRLPRAPGVASGARDRRLGHRREALCVIASFALMAVAQSAVWSFNERIAKGLGMGAEGAGLLLATTGLVSLAGSTAAVTLGVRAGRVGPLWLSIVATTVAVTGVVHARDRLELYLANALWAFFFAFAAPYFLGALASLDPSGRWAAIGGGSTYIGAAIGPALAAAITTPGDFTALVGLVAAFSFVAALALAPARRSI